MKIAVLASGGVDSSVALRLLKDQGHELHAFYLKIWLEDELAYLGECPWEEDLKYVEQICKDADVPLTIVPLQKEYWDAVVSYTLADLKAGRTPNPDMMCNQRVKFGAFLDFIEREHAGEFEKIASGHYADSETKEGTSYLKKAKDSFKDQTYFLAQLSQQQMQKVFFPLGQYSKSEVRELAATYDLPNQKRKDSQGICFLGKIEFAQFVKHHLGTKTGDIISFDTGEKIAEHEGYWFYTLGQRRGIGLSGGPWYVVKKDIEKNIIYVSNEYFDGSKPRDEFEVEDLNWISGLAPTKDELESGGLQVKLRHGEKMYACRAIESSKKSASGRAAYKVKIDGQDQGIASGQFAVFYVGDYCLGGGVISS